MCRAVDVINRVCADHPGRTGIAISGGTDSSIVTDIAYRYTEHRPPLFAGMYARKWPETREHNDATARRYGATIHHLPDVRPPDPADWQQHGWPYLGKMLDQAWNKAHRGRGMGFDLCTTGCCQRTLVEPKRAAMKAAGMTAQITGARGSQENKPRAMHAKNRGLIYYHAGHDITVANPLTGWTELMRRRYVQTHALPLHPRRYQGATSIGCVTCGGGSSRIGSCAQILRKLDPAWWRRHIVEHGAGRITLAIRFDVPLDVIDEAVARAGGLEHLAATRPWLFDFTTVPPYPGLSPDERPTWAAAAATGGTP
jgi:3'-phosphoadenosine 5'-phosphosulfate sulfotransferase (PAPS reductase)/FAD synthetase